MLIAAIARVANQHRHLAAALTRVAHIIERGIHPRWEIEQLATHTRMLFGEIAQITPRGKYAAHAILRHTANGVKQAKFQSTGDFI